LNQTGKSYYGDIYTSKPDPKEKKGEGEKQDSKDKKTESLQNRKQQLKKYGTLSSEAWSESE
jgi:hypothetical protein